MDGDEDEDEEEDEEDEEDADPVSSKGVTHLVSQFPFLALPVSISIPLFFVEPAIDTAAAGQVESKVDGSQTGGHDQAQRRDLC